MRTTGAAETSSVAVGMTVPCLAMSDRYVLERCHIPECDWRCVTFQALSRVVLTNQEPLLRGMTS